MEKIDNRIENETTTQRVKFGATGFASNVAMWVFFLLASAFLLRPILLTSIAADDLINPFSQMYHAGTGFEAILRRTVRLVSATGHFNYVGQLFGASVLALWNYLIGDLGIRFSLVYASTKFLVYILSFEVSARCLRHAVRFCGASIDIWPLRIALLVAISFPIQIHIPWSNDPVASYPLSGYLTATIGIAFISLIFRLIEGRGYLFALFTGTFGACAVLYYEFNVFAIMSSAPLLGYFVWKSNIDRREIKRAVVKSVLAVLPAATTTAFFYLNNQGASANYSGTALSLAPPFPKVFAQGLVSALPTSSWNIALEWLPNSLTFHATFWRQLSFGLVSLFLLLGLYRWKTRSKNNLKFSCPQLLLAITPFLMYWVGATFTQTSTVKVQQEVMRVGQVYNYYAVGSICFAIIIVLAMTLIKWTRVLLLLRVFLIGGLLGLGSLQYFINWNVTTQFNLANGGTRSLLTAFAEKPPMSERCEALNSWKSMGWPEYYWLDMELGLNASYRFYQGEEFCSQ